MASIHRFTTFSNGYPNIFLILFPILLSILLIFSSFRRALRPNFSKILDYVEVFAHFYQQKASPGDKFRTFSLKLRKKAFKQVVIAALEAAASAVLAIICSIKSKNSAAFNLFCLVKGRIRRYLPRIDRLQRRIPPLSRGFYYNSPQIYQTLLPFSTFYHRISPIFLLLLPPSFHIIIPFLRYQQALLHLNCPLITSNPP